MAMMDKYADCTVQVKRKG